MDFRFPKMVYWGLAIVIAMPPGVVWPCGCKASGASIQKPREIGHTCCRRAHVELGTSPMSACAARHHSWEKSCCHSGCMACFTGACQCMGCSGQREPTPTPTPSPSRIHVDELVTISTPVYVPLQDAFGNFRQTPWADVSLLVPSAPERCTTLCRWLF